MGQSSPIPVLSLVVQLMIDIIFNEDAVLLRGIKFLCWL